MHGQVTPAATPAATPTPATAADTPHATETTPTRPHPAPPPTPADPTATTPPADGDGTARRTDRAYHLARTIAGFRTTISPDAAARLALLFTATPHPRRTGSPDRQP